MEDLNAAAPSSTEPRIDPNAGAPIDQLAPVEREAGAAGAGETGAAPAAALLGDISATTSAVGAESGVTPDAGDAGNADASPAGAPSVSGTASSARDASLDGGTEAAVLRADIASLQQQLTDAHAEVAKWQGLYNDATRSREPGEPPAAHRWISLLEGKLAVLEHDARDELLDVARQLREAF